MGVANANDGGNVQVTTSSHLFNIEILKPVGTSSMKAVQEGTSTSPTKFTWTSATDATWYNLYIYDGEVWKSNCIYSQKNIKALEWSVQLKPGTYQAHLAPINVHNWTNSNVVSFTVKADTYTISYNMNGGSGSIGNQTKNYNQDLTLSSTKPTRTGYDFVGWNTNSSATSAQYQPNDKYTANSSVTLYAVWKKLAENTPQIIVEDKTVSAGSEVKVNVSLKKNPGIVGIRFNVSYDTSVLTIQEAKGGIFKDTTFGSLTSPLSVVWGDSVHDDNKTDGTVVELVFKVKDTAKSGNYPIKITYDADDIFNSNLENVNFTVVNGSINVVEHIPGDVNGDGSINMKDYAVLQRYLNNWNVTIVKNAADVNADGSVNMKDYALLQRYLNGWDIQLK